MIDEIKDGEVIVVLRNKRVDHYYELTSPVGAFTEVGMLKQFLQNLKQEPGITFSTKSVSLN